jgi:hypothetical protein
VGIATGTVVAQAGISAEAPKLVRLQRQGVESAFRERLERVSPGDGMSATRLADRGDGYNASGGPVGVGTATAKSMILNLVSVHLIGMLGTQLFWGANPRAPIGG